MVGSIHHINVVIIILTTLHSSLNANQLRRLKERTCEKTTIPLCKEIGYNLTYMPNRFGHKSQFDAGLIIHQFWPLVLINCSPQLKHFICSLYAPVCDPLYKKEIVPCRGFCENVRNSCEPVMNQNGFRWPSHLECSSFPTRKENRICMKPQKADNSSSGPSIGSGSGEGNAMNTPVRDNKKHSSPGVVKKHPAIQQPQRPWNNNIQQGRRWKSRCTCTCRSPFVRPNGTLTANQNVPPCALPCGTSRLHPNEKKFATFWLALWTIVCFTSTVLTLLTYLLGRICFVFTERPIVLIALCQFVVSSAYLVRLVYGEAAITCNRNSGLVHYATTGPWPCTLTFVLTYFFSNVMWLWWVVLAMNWYLSIGLKWTQEAIANYSRYFHFMPWFIPTVQTMAVLAMAGVDADPVAGICSVGNSDSNLLNVFVIAPLLVYTTLSLTFVTAGCVAISKSNKITKHHAVSQIVTSSQHCSCFSRIGLFTLALFVPALSLIGCHFYEHTWREAWTATVNCGCVAVRAYPNLYVFLLKYLMGMVVGLLNGVWMLETRTFVTWKMFLSKLFTVCRKRRTKNALLVERNSYPVHLW